MKIRPVNIRNFRTNKVKNIFQKYVVEQVRDSSIGRVVVINGPKKQYNLYQCRNPLTIIKPPLKDGDPAIQIKVPLFFVGVGKIQGCIFFAEIDGELVPYTRKGQGSCMCPLGDFV